MSSFSQEESSILDFDTGAVEPQEAFDPLPAGDYHCLIEKAQVLPTKDGTGKRVSIQLRVISPEKYAKRTVFDGLNVLNKSEKAQEIGRRQLAGLLEACGKKGERDMTSLVQCEVIAKVKIKEADGKYEAGNEVRGYKPVGGAVAAQPSAPATPDEKKVPGFMAKKVAATPPKLA